MTENMNHTEEGLLWRLITSDGYSDIACDKVNECHQKIWKMKVKVY